MNTFLFFMYEYLIKGVTNFTITFVLPDSIYFRFSEKLRASLVKPIGKNYWLALKLNHLLLKCEGKSSKLDSGRFLSLPALKHTVFHVNKAPIKVSISFSSRAQIWTLSHPRGQTARDQVISFT